MSLFRTEHLSPPLKDELEVTVFGPGYGESIVLHIPRVGWGVVDSCVKRVNGQSVVLPLAYLNEILCPSYPKLAFVILTHPHQDHYLGMDRLVEEYPGGIDRICRYNGDGVRELQAHLAHQYIATGKKPGLAKVFDAFRKAEKNGTQIKRLNEQFLIIDEKYKLDSQEKISIRMLALSPSAKSQEKYRNILFKSIPHPGKKMPLLDDQAHNLLSVAILLSIGDFQILLGSDVENGVDDKTGWEGILHNTDIPNLSARFVKVSHHGGKSGFHENIWKKNNPEKPPIGVITPYNKGKNFLPQPNDIQRLKPHTEKLGITHIYDFDTNLYKYYPKAVVDRLKLHAQDPIVCKESSNISFIRTRFDLDGNVTEQIVEPSAQLM